MRRDRELQGPPPDRDGGDLAQRCECAVATVAARAGSDTVDLDRQPVYTGAVGPEHRHLLPGWTDGQRDGPVAELARLDDHLLRRQRRRALRRRDRGRRRTVAPGTEIGQQGNRDHEPGKEHELDRDVAPQLHGGRARHEPVAVDPADRDEGPADRSHGPLGTLRLSVHPKDASVYVDGKFWGTYYAARYGAQLRAKGAAENFIISEVTAH